ncbi:MAG TPA: histidine kinase, partial [Puia sp.]|nr:histidine kinase [Puia sp.]
MHPNISRWRYYGWFIAAFGLLWFLFKLGGITQFRAAFLSTLIDLGVGGGALVLIAEGLLPRYYLRGRRGIFFWGAGLTIAATGSAIVLLQLDRMGYSLSGYPEYLRRYKEHYFYWFWSDLVVGSYFLTGFIALGGTAIRLNMERGLAAAKLANLERDKLQSELDALRSPMSAHFIFNALNTLYYTIDKSNDAARELTERFSGLLRYQLYECNAPLVPIGKELQLVEHFIALQKERLDPEVEVNCRGFGEVKQVYIPPYLLLPLVENCFKHLAGRDGRRIDLECSFRNGCFIWRAGNTCDHRGEEDKTGGLGLAVLRKRLAILYPDRHRLTSALKDGYYLATL